MQGHYIAQVEFTEFNIDIRKWLKIKSFPSLSTQLSWEFQRIQQPLLNSMEYLNIKGDT